MARRSRQRHREIFGNFVRKRGNGYAGNAAAVHDASFTGLSAKDFRISQHGAIFEHNVRCGGILQKEQECNRGKS